MVANNILLSRDRGIHQSRAYSPGSEAMKPICICPRCECMDRPLGISWDRSSLPSLYEDLVKVNRGTGLDAHHVGQKARMSNLVANLHRSGSREIVY